MNTIKFLKRKEIDEQKWNETVAHSNSLPYAFTWYLDCVAENWDALVSKNYEAVLPLVWLRKFGIKCLYQPYYCQQLGAFGEAITNELQTEFLNYAKKNFAYININLNASAKEVSEDFKLLHRKNLILNLNLPHEQLQKKYSENHKRNIKKAEKAGIVLEEENELTNFQIFYLANINRKKENFKTKHEKIFRGLTTTLLEKKVGKIFSAKDENGNLLAASLILLSQKRIINIINTSSERGKNSGASQFLFDKIIQHYSNSELTLDFEGSSIAGIARFYEGFGAEEEIFYRLETSIIKR